MNRRAGIWIFLTKLLTIAANTYNDFLEVAATGSGNKEIKKSTKLRQKNITEQTNLLDKKEIDIKTFLLRMTDRNKKIFSDCLYCELLRFTTTVIFLYFYLIINYLFHY